VKKRQHWKRRAAGATARAGDETRQAKASRAREASPPHDRRALAEGAARWRGIALDLAVVAANLFLLAPLARTLRAGGQGFLNAGRGVSGIVSPTVGWLFLSVFAAHALGAYLKRRPRQARLAARADGRRAGVALSSPAGKLLVGIACALLLFHFFIFMSLLFSGWQSTSLESWSPLFGAGASQNTYSAFVVRFILIIFIMPLPTALVAISLGGDGDDDADAPAATWRTHAATELCADLLLYFSIIVLTVVMNVLIAPRFISAGPGAGDVLASLIPLALAFTILYLPPRLVYLAEDYRSPLAWLTIALALLALAYRTFIPGDTFSW
jgi:hypothetical protein